MTAAVGLPTLRLVRWSVGPWTVAGLAPGRWREATVARGVLPSASAVMPASTAAQRVARGALRLKSR
jgi:23S rRNA pseudouridine2457 synthase